MEKYKKMEMLLINDYLKIEKFLKNNIRGSFDVYENVLNGRSVRYEEELSDVVTPMKLYRFLNISSVRSIHAYKDTMVNIVFLDRFKSSFSSDKAPEPPKQITLFIGKFKYYVTGETDFRESEVHTDDMGITRFYSGDWFTFDMTKKGVSANIDNEHETRIINPYFNNILKNIDTIHSNMTDACLEDAGNQPMYLNNNERGVEDFLNNLS